MEIVYVLSNHDTRIVEMATTNDKEAWAMWRDSRHLKLEVFLNKNLMYSIPRRG